VRGNSLRDSHSRQDQRFECSRLISSSRAQSAATLIPGGPFQFEYPLLAYSALHWTRHWAALPEDDKREIEKLLFRLFDTTSSESLQNYLNLYNPVLPNNIGISDGPRVANRPNNRRALQLGTSLYYACFLGLKSISQWIVNDAEKLESDDFANALGVAALAGNTSIVTLTQFRS
jgi:hypothetical protein